MKNEQLKEWRDCPDCHGNGWTWQRIDGLNGRATCLSCEGEGVICDIPLSNAPWRCKACGGVGGHDEGCRGETWADNERVVFVGIVTELLTALKMCVPSNCQALSPASPNYRGGKVCGKCAYCVGTAAIAKAEGETNLSSIAEVTSEMKQAKALSKRDVRRRRENGTGIGGTQAGLTTVAVSGSSAPPAQNPLPVPVLANTGRIAIKPRSDLEETQRKPSDGGARESTNVKSAALSERDSRGGQNFPTCRDCGRKLVNFDDLYFCGHCEEICDHKYVETLTGVKCVRCGHFVGNWE